MKCNLAWWSLENRSYDAGLIMFYKMAIPVPSYFEHPEVYTFHTPVCYYRYSFFSMTVVLWNQLPADLVFNCDIDSFKAGVRKIYVHP